MTGDCCRLDVRVLIFENLQSSVRVHHECGLCVQRIIKRFLRTLPGYAGKVNIQDLISFLENIPGQRIISSQPLSHAQRLRTLTREQECDV